MWRKKEEIKMANCNECANEANCPRLKQSRLIDADDTTYRLIVKFYGCHAFKERGKENGSNAST